jgi:hypothetical protein
VASKRLFWRTSQSSSTVAARAPARRPGRGLGDEFVDGEHGFDDWVGRERPAASGVVRRLAQVVGRAA